MRRREKAFLHATVCALGRVRVGVLAELRPRVAPEGAPGPRARQVGLRQGVLGAGAVAPQAV